VGSKFLDDPAGDVDRALGERAVDLALDLALLLHRPARLLEADELEGRHEDGEGRQREQTTTNEYPPGCLVYEIG
jgi:hypothetical protein